MIILVTGTPGVGKTTVAKKLAEVLKINYLHVSSFVIERKLYTEYDPIRQSFVIDEDKVIEELNKYIQGKDLVIETIYPSLISKADKVVVLRKNPLLLYDELKMRGWNDIKIAENVMSEALDVILSEALETFSEEKICQIDVTSKTVDKVVNAILSWKCENNPNWLADPKIQDLIFFLDKIINRVAEE